MLRYLPAVVAGKLARTAARIKKPGGGSAIPGVMVNKLAPSYLRHSLESFPDGLVVVSGSAGKSTTTKMLVAIARAHGLSVFTNPSTANIAQGLTSALLEQANLAGKVAGDIAILEMDEGHGAKVLADVDVRVAVLTNVTVDQVDRFFDPQMVQRYLRTIAERVTGALVLNADDALLGEIGDAALVPIEHFGFAESVRNAQTGGLGLAAPATNALPEGTGVRIVALDGTRCTVEIDGSRHAVTLPARGAHYAVDAAAAIAGARAMLGDRFDARLAAAAVSQSPAVFGRGERTQVRGQEVEFVLVQNTASLALNVAAIAPGTEQVLFAIGSDVRDLGYLWPAPLTTLGRVRIASGSKAADAALMLEYWGVEVDEVNPNLGEALDAFLALPAPASGVKTIVFSADSMRRSRTHLGLNV